MGGPDYIVSIGIGVGWGGLSGGFNLLSAGLHTSPPALHFKEGMEMQGFIFQKLQPKTAKKAKNLENLSCSLYLA